MSIRTVSFPTLGMAYDYFDEIYQPHDAVSSERMYNLGFAYHPRHPQPLYNTRRWARKISKLEVSKFTETGWGEIMMAHNANYYAIYDLKEHNQNWLAESANQAKESMNLDAIIAKVEDRVDYWFVEGNIFRKTYVLHQPGQSIFHSIHEADEAEEAEQAGYIYDEYTEAYYYNELELEVSNTGLFFPVATLAGKYAKRVLAGEKIGLISLEQQNQATENEIVISEIPSDFWILIGADGDPYNNSPETFKRIFSQTPFNMSQVPY